MPFYGWTDSVCRSCVASRSMHQELSTHPNWMHSSRAVSLGLTPSSFCMRIIACAYACVEEHHSQHRFACDVSKRPVVAAGGIPWTSSNCC